MRRAGRILHLLWLLARQYASHAIYSSQVARTNVLSVASRPLLTIFLVCAILSAAGWAIADDATTKPSTGMTTVTAGASARPDWCKPGYECITRQELSQATIRLIDLQEENARLKARSKRVGVHLTCGLGIAGVVTSNFDAKLTPAGFCGVGYGF